VEATVNRSRTLTVLPMLASALLVLTAACPAHADGTAARGSDVVAQDVWARATPAGAKMGAIYLTLTSAAGDRLLGAAVPRSVAAHTQIHETVMIPGPGGGEEGGRMTMREVRFIALPPGKAVELKPGGYHVMLLGLKQPLHEGDRVPLTLRLERAGTQALVATVRVE
jgi:copper(I)-binding protein